MPILLGAVINKTTFYSQKYPGLENKLHGHPRYKEFVQCGTANQLHTENADYPISVQCSFSQEPQAFLMKSTTLVPQTTACRLEDPTLSLQMPRIQSYSFLSPAGKVKSFSRFYHSHLKTISSAEMEMSTF